MLTLPFRGTWQARNSPARRVPSHGTNLFATTYAIDFVAVERRRTARTRDWRTLLATEPPDRFFAFEQPILAPVDGRVVSVHDGEPDHVARRSPLAKVPYALTQAARARGGEGALAGNNVILELLDHTGHIVLAHLRAGSIRVAVGDSVHIGQDLATCGNSGNSTQPHLHVQAMDLADPLVASGLPMAFTTYRTWPRRGRSPTRVEVGMPAESDIVESLPRLGHGTDDTA